MMIGGGIEKTELPTILRGKGDEMDKLRFAIMYLRESDVDASAFQYVKKYKVNKYRISINKFFHVCGLYTLRLTVSSVWYTLCHEKLLASSGSIIYSSFISAGNCSSPSSILLGREP
ncbi:unnamed protein product [Fraxinus pennsylvanica]|uniref:Uncharacterized protein n=1 Tax=Fraxinus pennsylvanica TaxID=56036 RepID=A0AAD1ZUZ5_9LAMI|nr:unnamed protein product [Fraxinus pennsylvanica]